MVTIAYIGLLLNINLTITGKLYIPNGYISKCTMWHLPTIKNKNKSQKYNKLTENKTALFK